MHNINELKEKLEGTQDSVDKINLLNELAETVRFSNLQESLKYSKQAVDVSESIDNLPGQARSYWNYGINLRLVSQLIESLKYFEAALKIYDKLDDSNGQATVLNSIANIHANSGDYQKALEFLNKSYRLLEKIENREIESSILSNFGSVYQEMGDYSTALEYYLKSSLIHTEYLQGIPETLLNNIGEVYKMLGEYETALEYYFKSLKLAREKNNKSDEGFALLNLALVYGTLNDFEKAIMYLRESTEILKDLGYNPPDHVSVSLQRVDKSNLTESEKAMDFQFRVLALRDSISDKSGKAHTMSNIGNLYFSAGKLNLAEKYYLDSLKLSLELSDKINQTQNLLFLGRLYLKSKDYTRGFENLTKALVLAQERNAKKDIYEIHKTFYDGYKNAGEYSRALKHLEKFYNIEKDVFNSESDKKLRSLTLKHESENAEKEKKIALQENEIFRLRNVELARANDKLKFLNEEKNDFMGIAAHDLKNPLTGILSLAKRIQKYEEAGSPEQLKEYGQDIEKASEKMFEMITKMLDVTAIESGKRNIKPEPFNGVVIAQRVLLDYRQKAESKQIQVVFNSDENIQVVLDRVALREILDNVFSNAIKFSPLGKKVYFTINSTDDKIRFSIKDEGPGLTEKDKSKLFGKFSRLSAQPTAGENSTGLGLSIAKKLTEAMNGTIWCESEEGNGAEFIIELPKDYQLQR
jgi:signal transduction histidine kinase